MNKQSAFRALVLPLLLTPAAAAWAHPGHGDETTSLGLLHMFEPIHLLPVLFDASELRHQLETRLPPLRTPD